MASETATDTVPPLTRLAAAALCRPWLSARSPTLLDGLPTDLVKLVWKEVRAHGSSTRKRGHRIGREPHPPLRTLAARA